jgi:glycosyltransferase involved in cell wall biosynthesis
MKKILFFGNGAQMNYVIVKYLRKYTDYEPDLLLQDYNHPILDHPAWEDVPVKISHTMLHEDLPNAIQIFNQAIQEKRWSMPEWIKENKIEYSLVDKFITKYIDKFHTMKKQIKHYVNSLKNYDFVISDGFGAASALMAHVQYAIRPYGTDVDMMPFEKGYRGDIVRQTFQNSFAILGQHGMANLEKIKGTKGKIRPISVIIDTEQLVPKKRDRQVKTEFFLAARLDFKIKGTDKAIRAFKRLVDSYDANLSCLEYGSDVEKTHQLVKDLNLGKYVSFHNFTASKPVLAEMYQSYDAVICNLSLGNIGTTELEAMSCEKTVIAYTRLDSGLEQKMPIMNAHTEEEVYNKMVDVCEGRNLPTGMRDFVKTNYGAEQFIKTFDGLLNDLHA